MAPVISTQTAESHDQGLRRFRSGAALTDFEAVPPLKTEKELHKKAEGRISAVVYATSGKLRDILYVARFTLRRASAWQSAVGEREFDVHVLLFQLFLFRRVLLCLVLVVDFFAWLRVRQRTNGGNTRRI